MRAALVRGYGPPDVIKLEGDVPVPTPGDGELLIRVRFTTVNPADTKQRSGNLQMVMSHKFPVAFGQDFSGTVEIAPPTSSFRVGDEVYGCTAPRNGCGAEFVVARESECAPKPAGLDWAAAAQYVPLRVRICWTAWRCGRRATTGGGCVCAAWRCGRRATTGGDGFVCLPLGCLALDFFLAILKRVLTRGVARL